MENVKIIGIVKSLIIGAFFLKYSFSMHNTLVLVLIKSLKPQGPLFLLIILCIGPCACPLDKDDFIFRAYNLSFNSTY